MDAMKTAAIAVMAAVCGAPAWADGGDVPMGLGLQLGLRHTGAVGQTAEAWPRQLGDLRVVVNRNLARGVRGFFSAGVAYGRGEDPQGTVQVGRSVGLGFAIAMTEGVELSGEVTNRMDGDRSVLPDDWRLGISLEF